MVTQYSIVSVLVRPEIQEKISIGLLLFDANEVYLGFSRNKLHICKELVSPASYKIIKEIVENIERTIDRDKLKHSDPKSFKVYKNSNEENIFSPSYISYLSRYSNNVISYTSPKEIYLEINDKNFSTLFRKYVDEIIESLDYESPIKV